MDRARIDPAQDARAAADTAPGARSAFARAAAILRYGILITAGLGVIGLALGFAWFLARVPGEEATLGRNAEGIVVLTGGAARILDGIELLDAGRGNRLLITGVNPATKSVELARLTPRYARLFRCCIDIDHDATNTNTNAVETRRWVRRQGFRSLLVVTSAYHMQRAMAELGHELPDVVLIAAPVLTERERAEPWWSNLATARLVVSEYFKFVYAVVRIHMAPAHETAPMAAGGRSLG